MEKHPLVELSEQQLRGNKQYVPLVNNNPDVDAFLSPNGKFPHAFVLACLMDRQITAENAWLIPALIRDEVKGFDIETLHAIPLADLKEIFRKVSKHRFKDKMAEIFHFGVDKIFSQYHRDATKIWNDNPLSGILICRFLQFRGAGIKIATMATNILFRQFLVPLADRRCIDISPDIQVMRVLFRLGLISSESARDEAVYMARVLNSEYPGVIDFTCWNTGRKFCHPKEPNCVECNLKLFCEKYKTSDRKQAQ